MRILFRILFGLNKLLNNFSWFVRLKRHLPRGFFAERQFSLDTKIRKVYRVPGKKQEHHGRFCIFSSHSEQNKIHDFVLYYIREIRALGFEIIFVSTSPEWVDAELKKLEGFVHTIVWRENVGYDFGSYKAGISVLPQPLSSCNEVLLTNDSSYGPLFPLAPVFAHMGKRKYDMWGITDHYHSAGYHLMSYFLVLGKNTLRHELMNTFWGSLQMVPPHFKSTIITRYEIGLSRAVAQSGLRMGCYCPFEKLIKSKLQSGEHEREDFLRIREGKIVDIASVYWYWRELIINLKSPFIKRNLISQNPVNGAIADFPRVLHRTRYPTELIWQHLKAGN